eukprot:gene4569-14749_t
MFATYTAGLVQANVDSLVVLANAYNEVEWADCDEAQTDADLEEPRKWRETNPEALRSKEEADFKYFWRSWEKYQGAGRAEDKIQRAADLIVFNANVKVDNPAHYDQWIKDAARYAEMLM